MEPRLFEHLSMVVMLQEAHCFKQMRMLFQAAHGGFFVSKRNPVLELGRLLNTNKCTDTYIWLCTQYTCATLYLFQCLKIATFHICSLAISNVIAPFGLLGDAGNDMDCWIVVCLHVEQVKNNCSRSTNRYVELSTSD